MSRTSNITLGQKNGRPYLFLEGKYLVQAGFEPGTRISLEGERGKLRIRIDPAGSKKVSSKKSGAGVIDVNNQWLGELFKAGDTVEVTTRRGLVEIRKTRTRRMAAARALVLTAASVFGGGGLLAQAATDAGFENIATIERHEKYAEIHDRNHGGHTYAVSIEQVSTGQMRRHGRVGLLTMGLPCQPYSRIRRTARDGKSKATETWADHDLGDMFYWALRSIEGFNPHTLVAEEVPGFLGSDAFKIFVRVLERLEYQAIEARVLNPVDYGGITGRKRACLVATMHDRVDWPTPVPQERRVEEILQPHTDPDLQWFTRQTKPWLYEHWDRQTAKGNGFQPPVISGCEPYLPTIKRRYFAGQGDNFVIGHPFKPGTHRWMTLLEAKRAMGLPEGYELGETKTTAGEVIGQGVEVPLFTRVIRSVCRLEAAERIAA